MAGGGSDGLTGSYLICSLITTPYENMHEEFQSVASCYGMVASSRDSGGRQSGYLIRCHVPPSLFGGKAPCFSIGKAALI